MDCNLLSKIQSFHKLVFKNFCSLIFWVIIDKNYIVNNKLAFFAHSEFIVNKLAIRNKEQMPQSIFNILTEPEIKAAVPTQNERFHATRVSGQTMRFRKKLGFFLIHGQILFILSQIYFGYSPSQSNGKSMLKNAKRSFKRTSVKSDNSDCEAFYLKQSERATTAKNQLLYLTSVNEKFYSTGAINYRQKCPKLHQSYDSWHNQSLDLQEYTPKKIQKSAQNLKASIANIEELETPRVSYSRHLIQSADCTIFKKKRSSIRNPANKPQSSIIEINSNNLNTINFCKSLNSSHQQLRASSNIMKRKIKTLSAHPDNRHASLKNYNNQSKNSLIFDFGLPRDGKVGSTGVLLSSFKRKNNKKGNWLHRSSKISSNMCRIEQFKTSNSPLKREIDKILRLLNEQSTYGKASPYE